MYVVRDREDERPPGRKDAPDLPEDGLEVGHVLEGAVREDGAKGPVPEGHPRRARRAEAPVGTAPRRLPQHRQVEVDADIDGAEEDLREVAVAAPDVEEGSRERPVLEEEPSLDRPDERPEGGDLPEVLPEEVPNGAVRHGRGLPDPRGRLDRSSSKSCS